MSIFLLVLNNSKYGTWGWNPQLWCFCEEKYHGEIFGHKFQLPKPTFYHVLLRLAKEANVVAKQSNIWKIKVISGETCTHEET